jgi:hypothetical protein
MTKVVLAVSIAAIVLGGAALAFRLANYTNENASMTGTSTKPDVKPPTLEQPLQRETAFQVSTSGNGLTGNLTVFLLPVDSQRYRASEVIDKIDSIVGDAVVTTQQSNNLGASPAGQYGDEQVEVTWNNDPDGFSKGQIITKSVIKKPAETVKFYIDPEIKNPVTGNAFAASDIYENYSLGNGITCCGIELREDVYPADTNVEVAMFVVDWAFDEYIIERLDEIKAAIN